MNNLTEQEKKFADAFVYLFFHAPALMPGMKEDAAVYAGYDVPCLLYTSTGIVVFM